MPVPQSEAYLECLTARSKIDSEDFIGAARHLVGALAKTVPEITESNWPDAIKQCVQRLLFLGYKDCAATVLWGNNVYNPNPQSVRRVTEALRDYFKVAIIGASGQGKTYSIIVDYALDYIEDPEYTTIKIISSTAGGADSNAQSTLATLWKTSCIPLPGEVIGGYIGLDSNVKRFGIERIAVRPGDDAKGSLKGKCHPFPRAKPHPKFGTHSRVRILIDEDETVPEGIWPEVNNALSAIDSKGSVKVTRVTNPKNKTSRSGVLNEPIKGWESIRLDGPHEWESKHGWHVVRLDAAMSENVLQKRIVYPGMMTYEGYSSYLGNDALIVEYYTYARGFYPPQGVYGSVVSEVVLNRSFGEFIYASRTTPIAGVDTALEGGDHCVMTFGRIGRAIGWSDFHGKNEMFPNAIIGIQVEQQIILPKAQTVDMAQEIKAKCDMFQIKPNFLALDRTGNGAGVHDHLLRYWSPDVIGVDFGTAAEDEYVLKEDTQMASEVYDGLVTQLHFQASKLMESGNIKLGTQLQGTDLSRELLARKYRQSGKNKRRVQSKKDYKAENGNASPDYADSFACLVQSGRKFGEFEAAMDYKQPELPESLGFTIDSGATNVSFVDFNDV